MIAEASAPLLMPSIANLREHWGARKRRAENQRAIAGVLAAKISSTLCRDGVCRCAGELATRTVRVTITRVAQRRLDDDNATISAKSVRDGVAAFFGVNDGDPRWTWAVDQDKGAPSVRVRIEVLP